MTAADYVDWCDFAGFYLGNASHAERYRAYEPKISPAGLTTVIVHDFLGDNDGGIDLQRWRSGDVYEVGLDADFRIEQTARALEAIGAARTAAKVRTVQDTSPFAKFFQLPGNPQAIREMMEQADLPAMMEDFRARVARALPVPPDFPVPERKPVALDSDIDTWEQVEHLLEKYLHAHQAELRGDMEKHGDVRAQPGFDPDKRRRELDELHRRELDVERQRQQVDKMRQHVARLEKQLATDPNLKPARAAAPRRAILECYREYANRPAVELIPEMRDWLASAASLQEKHTAIFRPQPTQDKALLIRLDELGAYRVDLDGSSMTVIWDAPSGLDCDWTDFSLSLEAPAGKKKPLRTLLDACDRLRRRFAEHQAEWRRQVLEHFEIHRSQIQDWAFDDYERDADGNITEAAIFKAAGRGRIRIQLMDENLVEISVFFGVEWDDEHGLELNIVDEPAEPPADEDAAV
ncbi:MAG: hypothetical protein FJ271_21375 [Planctomycetes bacterium]|nr:hypothetical protein [Planctomycetota bacterium]